MARQIKPTLALVISALLLSVTADSSVHIMSNYNQLITSTTLNWLPHSHYSASHEVVIGGFEVVKEVSAPTRTPIFVCRALHNGILVIGGVKEGEKRCSVTSLSSVRSYEKYDLLENIDSAARVSWVDWDKYKSIPMGAISPSGLENYFVARHIAQEGTNDSFEQTHYIGTLNSKDHLGKITYIKMDGREGSAEKGQVLVETEPIRYELNSVKLNTHKTREKKRIPKILGTAILSNTGSQPGKVAEAFSYRYNYSQYWGQGHAILKGLNTTITLLNKTKLPDIAWGISEHKNDQDGVHTVEYLLDPGTAVNVTLLGNYTDMEIPYMGKLVAIYTDNTSKARSISGVRQVETMVDVRPEFSPVYFLNNNSLVPTTLPPPTTTTTTTTTTTPRPEPILMAKGVPSVEGSNMEAIDENMIVPPKKSEGTMQNDDGGPLSLKNKIEGENSLGNVFLPSLLTILASFTTAFIRIT